MITGIKLLNYQEQLRELNKAYNDYCKAEFGDSPIPLCAMMRTNEIGIMYTSDGNGCDYEITYDIREQKYKLYFCGELGKEIPSPLLDTIADLQNDFQYFYGLYIDETEAE